MPALVRKLHVDDEGPGVASLLQPGARTSQLKSGAGILITNPVHRRMVEAAAVHLELTPVFLAEGMLGAGMLSDFEVIIADAGSARAIRELLSANRGYGDGTTPAVVATFPRERVKGKAAPTHDPAFDGVLQLPQAPAPLAVKLGVLLYAHRAYARRHQSTVEELRLNRRIFRSLTSGVSVADATMFDLPLTYVNPAFEAMTGYSLEEARGRNCRFLQGNDRDQQGLDVIRRSLHGHSESTVVIRNYRKDGTQFWNELTMSPIRNRDGMLTHFVGIQNDVTLRVEYEEKVRESEKLAAVSKLASSIAHEINNPLESVMNLVYLAQTTECSSETHGYLAQVDLELQRVKLITSRSLRFYKQSTDARAMNCIEMLDSVLGLNGSRLLNLGVTVQRRDYPSLPIVCMESEIRQVLNNLVGNAIDAMPGGDGCLFVRSREASHPRTGIRGILFTIADTGIGINQTLLCKIYRAFFTTKGIAGTGLGLWISSEIVQRHHGSLRVRSREGKGTVFTLFLPRPESSNAQTKSEG